MADDEPLKPEDFPVHTNQKQIVKNDGKTIAEARTKKTAEDVAERGPRSLMHFSSAQP